jgi:hypothetical protein
MAINTIADFPIQPTKHLHVRRVDDGWLVWLHGTPHTKHHTYLYLYDTGQIDRVTESADGDIAILRVQGAAHKTTEKDT